MATDSRSVVITLKLDSQESNEVQSNPTNTEQPKQNTDKDSNSKAVAAWAAMQLLEIVKDEAIAWADYYWERELVLNDDYVGQRNKRIALTHINRVSSYVGTVGSATAQGAMIGGAAGAIVGAIVGGIKVASTIIRSNVQGQDQQDIALRQMDAQLQFTRSRAGWSTKAASIGEDL